VLYPQNSDRIVTIDYVLYSSGVFTCIGALGTSRPVCPLVKTALSGQVEDVVGYDTLGHCFFLEDGNERDNVFVHNVGLVTRPGSLLPSDRDATMCTELSVAARRFRHVPDTDTECMYARFFYYSAITATNVFYQKKLQQKSTGIDMEQNYVAVILCTGLPQD